MNWRKKAWEDPQNKIIVVFFACLFIGLIYWSFQGFTNEKRFCWLVLLGLAVLIYFMERRYYKKLEE